MFLGLLSFYLPGYATALVYMLQKTEYQIGPYLRWHWRTTNYNVLIYRGKLNKTLKARLLLYFLRVGMTIQVVISALLIFMGYVQGEAGYIELGIIMFLAYPIFWAYLVTLPILLGRFLFVLPRQQASILQSKRIFAKHKAVKIAVAGSYGKTTMKELLAVVLAEGKKVAVTPANQNVASSHAKFASRLKGDEEVLVIEYGEGKPGDVVKFTNTTQPNIGIITGLAPAHLDHYASTQEAGQDIFYLAKYLKNQNVYVNGESEPTKQFIQSGEVVYNSTNVGEWKIKNINVDYNGTRFVLHNKNKELFLQSRLLGRHQVGPLAAVAVIGLSLGLSRAEVMNGISKTVPFEHRMQPRQMSGAWIIDDTYNGNIDGMKAGLELLKELKAKRKIFVTPGLVDQGIETETVHLTLGKLIAEAKPDRVVLMLNSVVDIIAEGLKLGHYKGEIMIEEDPLNFYTNLDQFLAAGDLVLMQNDWPDNYY